MAFLQGYIRLPYALAIGDALIAFYNDTVGSRGVRSLVDAVAGPCTFQEQQSFTLIHFSVTVRVRPAVGDMEKIGWSLGIFWNRTRNFARTDLRSIKLNHIGRGLGEDGDSH